MADNDELTSKRRLMEDLANSVIGLCTVSRQTKISYFRIEQEIQNNVDKQLLWWPQHNYQTGSMFEGMHVNVCSDHDMMMRKRIFPIVLWESQTPGLEDQTSSVGYAVAEQTEPVFLRLKVEDKDGLNIDIQRLVNNDGYLKTDDFIEYNRTSVNEYSIDGSEKHGPSVSSKVRTASNGKGNIILVDNVFCLKCKSWPSFANNFFTRKRPNWPSPDLVETVRQVECLVVAVGHQNSRHIDTEWRLSFSLAERELIQKIPRMYAECMYALKAVKSKYIVYGELDKPTPFCSYFIKTACLWVCERSSDEHQTVMDVSRKVIDWLINSYKQRNLKHYFIPQQNLIEHLATERCDGVIDQLESVKKDLWTMVMSSLPIASFVRTDVINSMCDALGIPRVNTPDDFSALETNLLGHSRATEKIKLAIEQLEPGGSTHSTYRYLENSMWAAKDFPSLLRVFDAVANTQETSSEIMKIPEDIMRPIVDNIETIVLEGYGPLFKQRLYRFLGDVYTYLLIYFRRFGIQQLEPYRSLYCKKPLQYYELGIDMVYPDKWSDNQVGGRAVLVIYHYLMANYSELKEKLKVLLPISLAVNKDKVMMNRQINVEISTPFPLAMNAWEVADELLHHFAKIQHRILLHPIALALYINARLSLVEGKTENARLMVQEMTTCVNTILRHEVKATTVLLIHIVQSLIGLLEVMRKIHYLRIH